MDEKIICISATYTHPDWEQAREQARKRIDAKRAELDAFQRSRRTTEPAKRPLPTATSTGDSERFASVFAELKASRDGTALGKKHFGDPWKATRALNIPVIRRDAHALSIDAGRSVYGRWMPSTKHIELAANVSAYEQCRTLAHELGHYIMGHTDNSDDAEQQANVFMRAFLAETPNPMMERAKAKQKWDEEALARALRRR